MVVITAKAWETNEEKSVVPDPAYFGFQDLTSDYYQTLIESGRPKYCRILWGILMAVLLGFTGYMVYRLLHDYFQYDSYNTFKVKWTKNVTLPAITICSTNYINYTALVELMKEEGSEDLAKKFEVATEKLQLYNGLGDLKDYINIADFEEINEWENENGTLDMVFGNNVFDMIIGSADYKFDGYEKWIYDFNRVTLSTELGQCFELNDDGILQQNIAGHNGAFSITLDAHVETYMHTTPTKGFILFIRDQEETVKLNQGGYVIAPGTETFVKLDGRKVQRLSKPFGTCQNNPSSYTKYKAVHYQSVRECIQEQKFELMWKVCECLPWYWAYRMYSLDKTSQLDAAVAYIDKIRAGTNNTASGENVRKKHILSQRDELLRQFNPSQKKAPFIKHLERNLDRRKRGAEEEKKPSPADGTEEAPTKEPIYDTKYGNYICNYMYLQTCNILVDQYYKSEKADDDVPFCPEPCSFNEWSVEISSTQFPPTEEYFDEFITYNQWRDPAPTYPEAKESLARLHIYYDAIKVTNVEQVKTYEVQNFIAEFGGTVDLFIGFSFFTIFQLFEILIAVIVFKCCNKKILDDQPSINESEHHLGPLPGIIKEPAQQSSEAVIDVIKPLRNTLSTLTQ